MKYTKGQKIYKFKLVGSGQYSSYKVAIKEPLYTTLKYALHIGLLKPENDASRGVKLGDYFHVVKDFDTEFVELKRKEAKAAKDEIESAVLPNSISDIFTTMSDNGFFVIDGVKYSNFYGNGENRVEVCKCDFEAFKDAKMLTRRQAYSPNDPITIIKFDAPKAISVKISDIDDEFGTREIENACGFVIWAKKLKIFVAE